MKLSIIYLSVSVTLISITSLSSFPSKALDLSAMAKVPTEKINAISKETSVPLQSNAMIDYVATQLNIPKATVAASFGSLLKVAKDNLSTADFALMSKALPDLQNYLNKAPQITESSMSSLFASAGDVGKKAKSVDYLHSAMKSLGITTEQVPALINSFSDYLNNNGYKEVAVTLKQGLSLL